MKLKLANWLTYDERREVFQRVKGNKPPRHSIKKSYRAAAFVVAPPKR